jgi:hypothetical protein
MEDDDDNHYIPSTEALAMMEEVEALEAKFQPLPADFYYRGPSKSAGGKTKKKKKKQMKLKAAVKNMKKEPVNFQGVAIDKCIHAPELKKHVFIHPSYDKAWMKCQKEAQFIPMASDSHFCKECNLRPCSARMLQSKLECDACTIQDLIQMSEDEHREKLRLFYRAQICKLQGKRFMNRQMPTNNDIPLCAKRVTAQIASIEAGGYDSLTDHPCGFKFSTRSIQQRLAADLENDSYYNSASEEEENCFE